MKQMYCDTAAYHTLVEGLRAKAQSEILDFGSRVHLFAKNFGLDPANPFAWWDGVTSAKHDPEFTNSLRETCIAITKQPLSPALIVEKYFDAPFYSEVHGDTTYQVNICGTMDRVEYDEFTNIVTIVDWKTTRKWKLSEVLDGYRVSTQFPFYANALRRLPHLLPDLRAVAAAAAGNIQVKVAAIKVASTDSEGKMRPAEIKMSAPMFWSKSALDEYEKILTTYASALIHIARTNAPTKNGYLADQCPGCEYAILCHAQSLESYTLSKQAFFTAQPYDPSTFGKPQDQE